MESIHAIRRCLCCALLVLGLCAPVWAQPAPDGGNQTLDSGESIPRPWAEGVSADDQRAAVELFEQGNALLADSVFVKAAEIYREALKLWDHPAIHYNLALALLNLDQPIQVYEALEKAMAYGPAPLDLDKFERAQSYKALVEKQLATVEIVCEVPGARVSLDGKEVFVAPGRHKALVRAGDHSILATKPGFLPTNETREFEAGEAAVITLELFTADDKTIRVRRWDSWKPWAVVSAGVAVGLVGGGMHYLSNANFDEFNRRVDEECPPEGCVDFPTDQRDTARLQQTIAISSYVTAGAVLTTGAILVYINREKLVRTDTVESSERVTLVPMLAPGQASLVAHFHF